MGRRKHDETNDDDLLTITPRRHGELLPAADGDVLVTSGIGPAGELVALWSTASDRDALRARTVLAGGAIAPDAKPPHPAIARVTYHQPELVGAVSIPDLRVAHPTVQPLPGGRLLVAGARCQWRPDGPDRNGVVYDEAGTVVAEATLDDGINRVATSADGKIWVGYFDEGIYGSYGWERPGATPIGSPGIVCFNSDMRVSWRYDGPGPIEDCYALNVAGETVWSCFHSGFPIVRIDSGSVSSWRNEFDGVGNLLVDGSTVALVGGYPPERDRVVVGTLSDDRFQLRSRARLRLPDRFDSRAPRVRMTARGSELHMLAGTSWLKLNLEDLLSPASPM